MHGLQVTDLKQLFGDDEAFVAYGLEKFHLDDLLLDAAGNRAVNATWRQQFKIGLSRIFFFKFEFLLKNVTRTFDGVIGRRHRKFICGV